MSIGHIESNQLIGTLNNTTSFNGVLHDTISLIGKLTIGTVIEQEIDYYEGNYELKPLDEDIVLETENKMLTQNLKITAVPYAEVTNEQNGTTVTIGG